MWRHDELDLMECASCCWMGFMILDTDRQTDRQICTRLRETLARVYEYTWLDKASTIPSCTIILIGSNFLVSFSRSDPSVLSHYQLLL